jgi:hypothetical protein
LNNELYLLLKKIYYQINDEIIINIFKKNLLNLEIEDNIISGLIYNSNYKVLEFLLNHNKMIIKTDHILMAGYTFDIFKLLITNLPENTIFSNDEILLGIKDECLSDDTVIYLIENKYLKLSPNVITFLLVLNCDYPKNIIIKIIQLYPYINYKVYEIITQIYNMFQQNIFNNIYSGYMKRKFKKIIMQFDYIIKNKNSLNIIQIDNPPYILANININEANLNFINNILEINNDNNHHQNIDYVDYEYIDDDDVNIDENSDIDTDDEN